MIDLEFEIYKGKKFSSLLKDIVLNSEDRNDTIEKIINDLQSLAKSANEALILAPVIREYLDVTVKNDEQLIKLAAIIQRIINSDNRGADNNDGGFGLTDEEKKQLLQEAEKITKELKMPLPKTPEKSIFQ